MVATSDTEECVASSDPTGAPQAEQKRLAIGTSARQTVHRDMNFPADSVTRFAGHGAAAQASKFSRLTVRVQTLLCVRHRTYQMC